MRWFLSVWMAMVAMADPVAGEEGLVEELLRSRPEWFGEIVEKVERYEVQVLYTQIDRDMENRPRFTRHAYRVDAEEYFYPASAVKLAGALLALEKLNRLGIGGLDRNTPLRIGSAYVGQTAVRKDESAANGLPSIGQYVKKVFLVSDNDAYNRLYEFLGQRHLNEALWEKGYGDVRLTRRLSVVLSAEQNRHTNPFTFYLPGKPERVLYRQPEAINPDEYRAPGPILRGVGHMAGGRLIGAPMDFAESNFTSVEVLQGMLKAAFFPESVPPEQGFDLTGDDYQFLYKVMGMLPRECRRPRYDSGRYYDSYGKVFLFGNSRKRMPDHIRVFNKAGMAYGYLLDNAYVADFENRVEFLLTAVISVNENQIYNDGVYEYDEKGIPFLAHLGRVIYEYELQREREYAPDLSRFAVDFAD